MSCMLAKSPVVPKSPRSKMTFKEDYLGWLGNPGKGRALGVGSVKFTGEVLKNVKMAEYIIDMKRVLIKEGTTVGLANGVLLADGKKIYTTENLKVGLFKS